MSLSFQEEIVPVAGEEPLEWHTLCTRVLGRELSIWDEFLRPLFLERAKVGSNEILTVS